VGEEGVLLEQQSDAARLGREVDPPGRVAEGCVAEGDAGVVGPEKAREEVQAGALARAAGADERQGLPGADLEGGVKGEASECEAGLKQ
jgi:hypothetical protein